MTSDQREWSRAKDELLDAVTSLGFPKELGDAMAKNLGIPKAMHRMTTYLYNEKTKTAEIAVDEMIAICSEIAAWKEKKKSEESNARYNEMLYYGLDSVEDDRED